MNRRVKVQPKLVTGFSCSGHTFDGVYCLDVTPEGFLKIDCLHPATENKAGSSIHAMYAPGEWSYYEETDS